MWNLIRRFISFYFENKFYLNYFSSKPILVYIGAANSLNLGDVLLYKAIQKIFAECIVVPNFPTSSIENPLALSLIRALGPIIFRGFRLPSAILLGGGTLMNNDDFFEKLKKEYISNVDFFIFGTAVQDLDFWGDHLKFEIDTYRTARLICTRNPYDADKLIEKGLQAEVIGDPVLYLCQPRQKEERLKKIGINIGCDRYKMHEKQDKVNEFTIELIRILIESGYEIELFAMHHHDAEDIEYVLNQVSDLPNITVSNQYQEWQLFLDRIHSYDLVIGQRLHAVITACGSGIPAISMSYRPKCLHFMESVEMEKYSIQIDQLDTTKILDLVWEIAANYHEIRNSLISRTNYYRDSIEISQQKAMQFLK